MTDLTTQPEFMSAVATGIDEIGSSISSANAAAVVPTSALLAPAADQVSSAITRLFNSHGQQYQMIAAQAAEFHSAFAQSVAAAGAAYSAAEDAAQALLGAGTAAPAATVALVMGGSGNPLPNQTFVDGVLNWATRSGYTWNTAQAVFTPENLYPLTGTKTLPLSTSVSEGVQMLDAAISQQIGAGNSVLVQGYSQSSIVASLEMQNLAAAGNPYSTSQLAFNLLGDPMNPNGGLLARFPGLSFPSLGLDFYGATPANTPYRTAIYSLEYDGFADFPKYPGNFLADANAVAGIVFVHPNYPHLDPAALPPGYTIVELPTSPGYTGATTYYMITGPNLPLVEPIRLIPVIGPAFADLLQGPLTPLVNYGYGNPNYGYTTGVESGPLYGTHTNYANVPTPFSVFPPLSDTLALGPALATGTQQGVTAFIKDLGQLSTPSLAGMSMSSGGGASLGALSLPTTLPTLPPITPTSIIQGIQALETANTNVVSALSGAASTAYSLLLPTADIINTVVISIPSYDVNLFLSGIDMAIGGDPTGGLTYAIAAPIAADIGLVTVAGGIEGLVLLGGVADIVKELATI